VGHPWPARLPESDVIAFCLRVSAGEIRAIGEIAAQLRRPWDVPSG
jgi:hypothetical protein